MTRRTVTVAADEFGDAVVRLSLGEPTYGECNGRLRGSQSIGTGVFARALWVGRKYVVLLTYSQWATRDGSVTGDGYSLCSPADARMIRRVFGDEAAEDALDTMRITAVDVNGEIARRVQP